MSPTVMGQKVEEILRACQELLRRMKETDDCNLKTIDMQATKIEDPHGITQEKGWRKFLNGWSIADRIQALLALGTFAAVAVGVVANMENAKLADLAQKTYEASTRPDVGVAEIKIIYEVKNGDLISKVEKIPENLSSVEKVDFSPTIKNYGSISAANTIVVWKMFYNGIEFGTHLDGPRQPERLFPGKEVHLIADMTFDDFKKYIRSGSVLEIETSIDFEGPSQKYHYCERERYLPDIASFGNVGQACSNQ